MAGRRTTPGWASCCFLMVMLYVQTNGWYTSSRCNCKCLFTSGEYQRLGGRYSPDRVDDGLFGIDEIGMESEPCRPQAY